VLLSSVGLIKHYLLMVTKIVHCLFSVCLHSDLSSDISKVLQLVMFSMEVQAPVYLSLSLHNGFIMETGVELMPSESWNLDENRSWSYQSAVKWTRFGEEVLRILCSEQRFSLEFGRLPLTPG
jgi:hypothetical protein